MIPGKTYTPEDMLHIVRRRFWFLVLPFALVAALAALYSRSLPNLYRSTAQILVVPQRVPESFVKATVTTRIEDRLPAIQQQILSRTVLEGLIQRFDLYAGPTRNEMMEDVVERMRTRDIEVKPSKGDAFDVSFVGRDPVTVMKVTSELASLFINESLKDRQHQAENTSDFLDAKLKEALTQLQDAERRLSAYKTEHAGQLPQQNDSNTQGLQNAQVQLRQTQTEISRALDHRASIDRDLRDAQAEPVLEPPAPVDPATAGRSATAQLEAAKNQLAGLYRRGFKDDWPEVQDWKRRVAELQPQADAEALAHPVGGAAAVTAAEQARRRRIQGLQNDQAEVDAEVVRLQKDEQHWHEVSADFQRRLDSEPMREVELTQLTRDYTAVTAGYNDLFTKKQNAKISESLENRAIGEQFKLNEPARLPERPISPNRQQINGMGMAAGLALGLALIALIEYRDTTLNTDEDISSALQLPVLAVVPAMESDEDRRRARRRSALVSVALGSTVAGCLAIVVYTLVR